MATSPAYTFQDHPAHAAVAAAVRKTSDPRRASSDTLDQVVADEERRNRLINDNNLLKGVVMGANGPAMSARELIARPSTLLYTVNQSASIHTTTVEAEYTQKLLESNYTSTSVKVSAPYVTASVDFSQETSYENTETTKTIMVSSRYLFPQGSIHFTPPGIGLDGEIKLSDGFASAIDDALGRPTPTAQREALDVIFNEYGHVFRTKVQIGGVLSAHTMETFNRSESESSVKKDITVGLEVAVQQWGAGITNGHGELETTITTSEGRTLDVKYLVQGGDYTQILDTNAWIASTDDSDFWRVIEVTEVVPVVDLLPEPQKATVKKLLLPLLGRWVPVEQTPYTDKFPVRIYQPKNAVPDGWYWLGHAADGSRGLIIKPTLPRKTGRNYAIATGKNAPGASNQPVATLPQYCFLSTYFVGFSPTLPLGAALAALRPGLFLEGDWKLYGTSYDTSLYVTSPKQPEGDEDECWDLQSCIQINLPGNASDNPPRPRWAIRKNVILFDSEEE